MLGLDVVLTGPALAVRTCARRLAASGFHRVVDPAGEHAPVDRADTDPLVLREQAHDDPAPLHVDISWFGPAGVDDGAGSEASVQAISGLMALHGADVEAPRRIGLEVASVGAGVLAAHAALAAAIGRRRGVEVEGVATSVLAAGLLIGSHRIAAATAGEPWVPAPPGPDPGPPFRSSDGHHFEIETLDEVAWRRFWRRLGAGETDLGWAWRVFRPRYFRGTCRLPAGLHETAGAHPLAAIRATADDCGVSLCAVRSYEEVLEEFGPDPGTPNVAPLPGSGAQHPVGGHGRAPGSGPGPLTGIRIVEATSRMQGPLASLLLQMLGAEVLHVEPPIGAFTRSVPPLVEGTGSFFRCFNRGKDTVELDLARQGGREQLREAVAEADVFLQNWRPGKAAEWSLDADALAQVNPGLVYARASGWGGEPALAHLLGTDFLVQARAGIGAGITPESEPPTPSRVLLTDHAGGLVTAEAMLAGLHRRQRTGRGQRVESSLLGGAMTLQAHVLEDLAAGREVKKRQRGRPVWCDLDRPLATADGYLSVTIEDDAALRRLTAACGIRPGQPADSPPGSALGERIAGATAAHWEQRLREAGLPCAAVRTELATVAGDPRLAGLLEPLGGSAVVPASPWRLQL